MSMIIVTSALSLRLGVFRSPWGQYPAVRCPIDKARTWCALRLAVGGVKGGGEGRRPWAVGKRG